MPSLTLLRQKLPLGFTLFSLGCLIILIGLGTWQVSRKTEKELILSTSEAAERAPIVGIDRVFEDKSFALWEYRRARLEGKFLHQYESRLLTLPRQGVQGFYVITPLALSSGPVLLVNRGWVRKGNEAKIERPVESVSLVGSIRMSQQPKLFTPQNQYKQRQLVIVNTEGFAGFHNLWNLLPFYAVVEPITPELPQVPLALGSHRHIPNNHFMYAVTWYTLALFVLALYMVVLVQWRGKKQ